MAFWNNPTVSGAEKRAGGLLKEFREFILRGNVVDLAVGIVIGAAFTSVVSGFVNDIINPLIPTSPSGLAGLVIHLPYSKGIAIGAFINAVISFLIVALIVYFFVVKPVNALMERFKPKETPAAPTTRECPYCLSNIPIQATRCAYCTSPVPPAQAPVPAAQTT
jgi:large conductance mechanosensitive channel